MAGFKARARALDMLGRQQIAGIPTAISELFKNAHDAYAENVIVDYFRSDKLFVLRDDGYGMTKKDFEEKWLTLGTESKLGGKLDETLLPIPEGKVRPIMGEKGIGRLAIASIGDHVLVLTRAKRKDGLHDLVMAFVYWRMYEIPGINLEHIIVPIKTIHGGRLPNANDFEELNSEVIANIVSLQKQGYLNDAEGLELLTPLENLSLVSEKIDKYLIGPSLKGDGFGTHFIICPVNEMLESSIDGDSFGKLSQREPPLRKTLLGFTNTMFPDSPKPVIKTSFRDHKTDEYFDDIIETTEFWNPDEYTKADHHISGEFDEYGQFRGSIKVYGKEFPDHIVNWKGNNGVKTQCGQFKINLAYFPGNARESVIPSDEHALIISKLNKISGLYLYRDMIRILPYGNNEYDFLDLEVDRNKSNAFYFFSYRRMFGAIDISKNTNPNLSEKAGREGLIENKAYRQLISILKNLFLQLAADFFRDSEKWGNQTGPGTEYYTKFKKELNRQYLAKQEFEKKSKEKKSKFQKELDDLFEKLNKEIYKVEFDNLNSELINNLEYCISIKDKDKAISTFLDIEKTVRKDYNNLIEYFKIQKPRGVALPKSTFQDYKTYLIEIEKLMTTVFKPEYDQIEIILNDYQSKLKVEINRRKRLEIAIESTIEKYKKTTKTEVSGVQEIAKKVSYDVITLSKELVSDFDKKVREIQTELAHIEPYQLDDNKLVSERNRMESVLIKEAEEIKETMNNIRNQLENIILSKEVSNIDMAEAYAEEVESLKDKLDTDLELSQLGLAVSAIQHEFQHTTKTIREQIRRLKAWADLNEGIDDIYKHFSINFEHLDNYLTLFTPLNRRLYRKEVNIYGNEIFEFVKSVFYARMSDERHQITFECSQTFSKNIIVGFPSTFYPVYTNIIDNAIFWLRDQPLPRKIFLDADNSGIYISNNGPSIDIRDQQRIFELGFTRKPLGRGMGLYISKQVLNKVGYDITIDKPRLEKGVSFKIGKITPNQ
ncbi:MAG: ATP-binding protein [Salinivirgaceae bacterium]